MNTLKNIIWDFDGVIANSIPYKYHGIWKDVFPNDTVKHEAIARFLATPEGKKTNRYGLIRHALAETEAPELKDVSDKALKEHPLIKRYGDLYGQFVIKGVVEIGMFPDIEAVLKDLYEDGYHMYIVSGGGTDESLKEITNGLNISQYFRGIFGFGNPKMPLTTFSKYANFERIVALEETNNADQYVVIGDGGADYQLAGDIGCAFIAIRTDDNQWDHDQVMAPYLVERKDIPQAVREGNLKVAQ